MKFDSFLAQRGMSFRQFHLLPAEERISIHTEWLNQPQDEGKRVDWGLIAFTLILAVGYFSRAVWR